MKNNFVKYKKFWGIKFICLFFLAVMGSINLKAEEGCSQLTLQYLPGTFYRASVDYIKCTGEPHRFQHHHDEPATLQVKTGSIVCLGLFGSTHCLRGGAGDKGFYMPEGAVTLTCSSPRVAPNMDCKPIPTFVPDNVCQCKNGRQSVCFEKNPAGDHRCDPSQGHCGCTQGRKCSPAGWCQG